MKTQLKWLFVMGLMTSLVSQIAFAQTEAQVLEADVDAEIDSMYPQSNVSTGKSNQGAVVTQTIVVPQQTTAQQSQQVQKQATTVVEASPLSDSRADAIRRGRQDEEMRTESRIVEKLEQSRMEDEKRRANVLFGDKFDALQNGQPQQAPPSNIQPQVIQQIAPAPVVIEDKETLTRDAVREEVRAALEEDATAVEATPDQRYFAGIAGIAQYPDVQAIRGNGTLGAAFGTRYDFFMVEGAFLYSSYNLDARYTDNYSTYIGTFDMNQYQGIVAAKYQLLGGFVRPNLGGLVSYSYRKYTTSDWAVAGNQYVPAGTEFGNSHAIDLGVAAGVDLEFNNKFSLGFDMKYMFNMSSKLSGPTAPGYTPLEKLQYFITGISARVNF